MQVLSRRPVHMSLINLGSGVEFNPQYNPTEIEETIAAAYNRQKVLGLSHSIPQYSNTENWEASFTLRFDALNPHSSNGSNSNGVTKAGDYLLAARQFLMGLCYARRGGQSVADGAPPRVLFVWPFLASLTCFVPEVRFRHLAFNYLAAPTRLDVSIKLEEIRDVRIYGEDVDVNGTFRTDNPSPELGY
jgi:hypothetical protein